MAEVAAVKQLVSPHESLLVADSLTGQDAVNIAKSFNERVGVSGIILTRVDGDGRGGAALSMRSVTGAPIKFLGAGEKLEALEAHTQVYVDAVCALLDEARGDWGEGSFYPGGYDVSYEPVVRGGRNLLQKAKVSFDVEVSK